MPLPLLPVLLSTVCLLLLVAYLVFRWRYRYVLAAAAKLPCPPSLPLLGNLHLILGRDAMRGSKNILKIASTVKGVFCVWIGPVPVFIINDPEDVQIILNSSGMLEKDDIYSFLRSFMGNGLLSAPAHTWKKYRKLINPVMHPSNVEHFLPVFNDIGRKLSQRLAVSSTPSDRKDEIFDSVLEAITKTVIASNALTDNIKKDVRFLIDSVGRIFILRSCKIWLHVDWLFKLIYWKELKETSTILGKQMDNINQGWEEEEAMRSAGPDVNKCGERLSGINLVDVVFDNRPVKTEDHDWRDEVTTLLGTGTDTVVCSLNFLLVTLGNHPEVQEKIFAEIQEVMGDLDRDVTAADINAMTYLGQAILESIRLHGSVSGILRKATKDTKLSGCTLPAGSRVIIVIYNMGLNRRHFQDPKQFLPERFSPEKQKERHNYSFIPFSAGPRNCIGKSYALMIMKTVLVHVLRRLRVTSHIKLSDIKYEMNMAMHSKSPLLVSVHPRYSGTS